ncbi:MAG: hypothetical protein WCO25_04355 [Candidatus Uhrbacteria bacterium]
MKESRGPIVEFLSSQKKKLLALAAGVAVAGGVVDHEAKPVAAQTVEVAKKPLTAHEAMMDALKRSDTGRTIETKAQIDARFATIDPLINLAYYKDNSKTMVIQVDRYLSVLHFAPLTDEDEAYKKMTLAEVGDRLRETIEHGKTQKIRDEARRILKGSLHEELIEAIRHMSPEEVVARRAFLGETVHGEKTEPFSNIVGAWGDKMTRASTTSERVRQNAPVVRDQLRGREGSLTLSSWIEKQEAAIDTFAAHAEELGYSPALIRLITPEVMLGVAHAEIFPDLDAETFVRTSPVLFETFNIAFAPATGDKRFSGGMAQMTAETFEAIIKKHRADLERIRDTDTGAAFSVPAAGSRKEFSTAMLTDEDSQFFYNVFVLAENTRLAMRTINTDKRFVAAWKKASDAERAYYTAALISMANNLPSAAKNAAEAALDEHPHSILEMARRLSEYTTVKTAARNGRVGGETMEFLVAMGEKKDSWN